MDLHEDSCCKRLIDRVDDGKCVFVMDEWAGFYRPLPENRHFLSKDVTFPIEAYNSDLRHCLARYIRKTTVSNSNLHIVQASLRLTHHTLNLNN
ncbi:MAG: hypothetical protein KA112_01365 [Alphaproteobacteria bacterium]|nr:hypothetical protein [Alphaproteobacteria bacterium]MBP7729250.1 hypothetical protein [Alphaproteobacteria bacterium]